MLEYVLPLKSDEDDPAELAELAAYLRGLTACADVTVVDGSSPPARLRHAAAFGDAVRSMPPDPWPGANGKVAGVVTGVRHARHEHVVVADDDVRWTPDQLVTAAALLEDADLVRPQNVFDAWPWHAREDGARSLLNRALGHDHPGTFALRRSTFLRMGGYDGDVLFENLELARTVAAAGGREVDAPGLLVARRPPTTRHFLGQRVRQAYDDLAEPRRLALELALLPAVAVAAVRRPGLLPAGALAAVALAERGRRRAGAATAFPSSTALWAPVWLLERAACVWLALLQRARGGVPYRGRRLRRAAHSPAELGVLVAGRAPLEPAGFALRAPGHPGAVSSGPSLADDPETARLWDEFHRAVTMTSRELEDWLRTREAAPEAEPLPDEAGTPLGRRVLAVLGKRRTDLTADDLRTMRRVVDIVAVERRDDLEPTAGEAHWRHRLMTVGHDPLKPPRT